MDYSFVSYLASSAVSLLCLDEPDFEVVSSFELVLDFSDIFKFDNVP